MASNVDGLRARAVERYRQVHDEAVRGLVAALKEAAPRREGTLADSIAADAQQATPAGFVSVVRATAPQAEWTNYGTVPHVIRPVTARALRFEVGGGVVFARYVNHPGSQGTRWWETTLDAEWSGQLRAAA